MADEKKTETPNIAKGSLEGMAQLRDSKGEPRGREKKRGFKDIIAQLLRKKS